MIVNSSLPSVDQLDAWGRELVHAKCALDPHALQSAIDTLLIRYCSVNRNPRIVSCYCQGSDPHAEAPSRQKFWIRP
jgi:hypothetical protein